MTELEMLEEFRRNKREQLNLTEINKLEEMLKAAGETYERHEMADGVQLVVYKDGNRYWDALISKYSCGHQAGLLEIMGKPVVDEKKDGDRVQGYLTAQEVMARAKGRSE